MFLDSVSHMDAGSRRRCCGCWCGRDQWLGCPVGMSGSGMGMLLGSRTATPRVFCGAVRCPHGVGLFPSGRVGNVWRVVV